MAWIVYLLIVTGRQAGGASSPAAVGDPIWLERETYAMGTRLAVVVPGTDRDAAARTVDLVFAAARQVEALLSTWRDDTELSRANRAPVGRAVPLSDPIVEWLVEVRYWQQSTGGAFDPAVGALVDAWDLRGEGRRPGPGEFRAAREATGLDRFAIDASGKTLTRRHPSAWIDPGGFGKGAALRAICEVVVGAGAHAGLVNFGGQTLAMGSAPGGGPWLVAVAHPSRRRQAVAHLAVRDRAVATSGQSERFVSLDGARVGHVLDPRSGRPVRAWGSVTVVAPDPLVADILSTALLVLGPDAGMRWLEGRTDVAALFLIETDGVVRQLWNRAMEPYLLDGE